MPLPIVQHNNMATTKQVTDAIATVLKEIQWEGRPAFQRVETTDLDDLIQAMQELMVFQDRFALIIPGSREFQTSLKGTEQHVQRQMNLDVVITDRNAGDRIKSVKGSTTNPGTSALADLVVSALVGKLLNGAFITPTDGDHFSIGLEEHPTVNRAAFRQGFRVIGGSILTNIETQVW